MKRLFLLTVTMVMVFATVLAQGNTVTCHGSVIDEQGEPLIGVTVAAKGSNVAVATDIDGNFTLKVPASTKELQLTYIGYKPLTVQAKGQTGVLRMEPDSQMLQDVVVTQSKARTRETPVAISELTAGQIEAKLGNKEFPEVLKTTPACGPLPRAAATETPKSTCAASRPPTWPCSSTACR